jgi:hypothetical protein
MHALATAPAGPPLARLRRETWALGLCAFAALVLLRGAVLADPPYWDALLGLFPQAHWLAVHGLDPLALLREQPGYMEGGACVYPFSVGPWMIALLERAVPAIETRFALLHLASFACAAITAAAVFRLVRPLSGLWAVLAAAAFLAQATSQALACQMGLELPFAAACAWTVVGLAEGSQRCAFLGALAALLIKPTGVVAPATALVVLLGRRLVPRAFGAARTGDTRWILAHAALVGVFVAELAVLAAFGRTPHGAGPFAGLAHLVLRRLPAVPEFGLGLLALTLALPAWIQRHVAHGRASAFEVAAVTFLVLYLLLLAQWDKPLPRYLVVAFPALAALLVRLAAAVLRGTAPVAALCATACLFGLLNAQGRFHPDRPAHVQAPVDGAPLAVNDGWLLERSLRYRDGLELDRRIARAAEARPGTVFVTSWPLVQALVEPAFGYVPRPLSVACPETPVRWTGALEDFAAVRAAAAGGADVLWILSPTDFLGPWSQPRPGDRLADRLAVGAQRAFFVRRGVWE